MSGRNYQTGGKKSMSGLTSIDRIFLVLGRPNSHISIKLVMAEEERTKGFQNGHRQSSIAPSCGPWWRCVIQVARCQMLTHMTIAVCYGDMHIELPNYMIIIIYVQPSLTPNRNRQARVRKTHILPGSIRPSNQFPQHTSPGNSADSVVHLVEHAILWGHRVYRTKWHSKASPDHTKYNG